MAKIDLARRAEIGRERRARTRAHIIEVGTMLLAERPLEALTVDTVVETAAVAKGTFYYHFQSMEELAAAVGEKLGESFDDLLAPVRLGMRDPVARLSFAFKRFLEKAILDPVWARLVVQSAQAPTEFARGVRANLKQDLTEARAQGRLNVNDVELAADIVMGIWLQVTRGILQGRTSTDLAERALDAMLRALGASAPQKRKKDLNS
ncbi:MAG: TetR/AcrR family transcriptional regulator [Hyphomicrobiales bacterium]|nr:TetR/AcrR family transcriptional regulator [Hyphomicrobiales bacterium]MBV9112460.1 TetR/AcrR family transcriptional regulator [Hyphomicrobiales bacterium]MBV9517991.1 TetR/AcrR family transcriptional regulator [Hyphomicrobiales bacterium]